MKFSKLRDLALVIVVIASKAAYSFPHFLFLTNCVRRCVLRAISWRFHVLGTISIALLVSTGGETPTVTPQTSNSSQKNFDFEQYVVQLLISQLYVNFLMIFERCSDFSNTFSRVPNAGALLLALYLSEYSAICFLFWEISDSKSFSCLGRFYFHSLLGVRFIYSEGEKLAHVFRGLYFS